MIIICYRHRSYYLQYYFDDCLFFITTTTATTTIIIVTTTTTTTAATTSSSSSSRSSSSSCCFSCSRICRCSRLRDCSASRILQDITGNEGSNYLTPVCWVVGCLTSQQHVSVYHGRICPDNCTRCHIAIEVAGQTFHFAQSQYTHTAPTSSSSDPITPGAWQGSHWEYQFLSHWYDSTRENPAHWYSTPPPPPSPNLPLSGPTP